MIYLQPYVISSWTSEKVIISTTTHRWLGESFKRTANFYSLTNIFNLNTLPLAVGVVLAHPITMKCIRCRYSSGSPFCTSTVMHSIHAEACNIEKSLRVCVNDLIWQLLQSNVLQIERPRFGFSCFVELKL